jgi:hypothetical protein
MLFSFKGVKGDEVRHLLASGAGDGESSRGSTRTVHRRPKPKSRPGPAGTEALRYYDNPEKRDWFVGECKRLGLDPQRTDVVRVPRRRRPPEL